MEAQQTHTWVKVPATTNQVADDPPNEIEKSFYETDETTPANPNGRGAADRSNAKGSILTPKSIMTVGCWNVRTLGYMRMEQLLYYCMNWKNSNGTLSELQKHIG